MVAKPDDKWGEVPCAFVSLKDGHELTETELIEFARENLAHYKVPFGRRVWRGVGHCVVWSCCFCWGLDGAACLLFTHTCVEGWKNAGRRPSIFKKNPTNQYANECAGPKAHHLRPAAQDLNGEGAEVPPAEPGEAEPSIKGDQPIVSASD